MQQKSLLFYLPVIHAGYLQLLEELRSQLNEIILIDSKLVSQLSDCEPQIGALTFKQSRELLRALGYVSAKMTAISEKKDLQALRKKSLILINDQVSRQIAHDYQLEDIEWKQVFLRWDRDAVFTENNLQFPLSQDKRHQKLMKLAYAQADMSGDWWRHVGALLVEDDDSVLASAYNRGIPDDHVPYQQGAIRDFLKPGEHPELANYMHAEQGIIAHAASKGLSTQGKRLFVTHFPCPVCAKLLAFSGISELYFSEGSASKDGEQVLAAAGLRIFQVV